MDIHMAPWYANTFMTGLEIHFLHSGSLIPSGTPYIYQQYLHNTGELESS